VEAGHKLAEALGEYADRQDVVVLGLPRGGVPVAFEIANHLHAPLDVMVVRKLGVPGEPELAMGAIAQGGVLYLNQDVIAALAISQDAIDAVTERERQELKRRERLFRGDRPPLRVGTRTAILVDDGLATGATMSAAVAALRQARAKRIGIAVPTAAADSLARLSKECDDVVCLATPDPYFAVGVWYQDFNQVSDEEVRELLDRAQQTETRTYPSTERVP